VAGGRTSRQPPDRPIARAWHPPGRRPRLLPKPVDLIVGCGAWSVPLLVLAAVAEVRRVVERDQPGAAAQARQTLDASLAAAHRLY
jgi:hypothetical protein